MDDHIASLFSQRQRLRSLGEFTSADEIRTSLQALGVVCNDRDSTWTKSKLPAAEDHHRPGYNLAWCESRCALEFTSLESFMAISHSWQSMPRLQTYREQLGKRSTEIHQLAEDLGRRLGQLMSESAWDGRAILCVEKPYLVESFVAAFLRAIQEAAVGKPQPPGSFVLLAINGGDRPLTTAAQAVLATLPGLCACYSHNLHAGDLTGPSPSGLFRSLPLGVLPMGQGAPSTPEGNALLARVRQNAVAFSDRDPRLLIPPLKANSRLRSAYIELLSRPEFAHLVRVVPQAPRLSLPAFLELLASHRSALSPPGRGHDCFRTWQVLAMGSVPWIVEDPLFDDAGILALGPRAIPAVKDLTPNGLRGLLDGLSPPDERAVAMSTWHRTWSEDLARGAAAAAAAGGRHGQREVTIAC